MKPGGHHDPIAIKRGPIPQLWDYLISQERSYLARHGNKWGTLEMWVPLNDFLNQGPEVPQIKQLCTN